nr:hypothetical protein [Tanacetum cinerariifolium]
MNQNYFEPNSSGFDQPSQYSINHQPLIIQEDLNQKLTSDEFMTELSNGLFTSIQSVVEMSRQREQAANLSTHTSEPSRRFNSICYDDDDEERSIHLRDIISQLPPSIVITTSPPVLPIEDPEDSLIMRNEELSTILEKESDKVIMSSVEDFVPISIESEDTSGSDNDFTSSDDESLFDEDVPEDNVKIYSNPLFEFDDEYIYNDVNPLFDEDCPDIEASRAHGFVHPPLKLQSFAYGNSISLILFI